MSQYEIIVTYAKYRDYYSGGSTAVAPDMSSQHFNSEISGPFSTPEMAEHFLGSIAMREDVIIAIIRPVK